MNTVTLGLATSPIVAALIIAAAFGFSVYAYRGTLPPVSAGRRWTLIMLRTTGIGLLLFCALEPVASFLNVGAEEPRVVVAVDNSQSMTLFGQDSSRIREARAVLRLFSESKPGINARYTLFSDSASPFLSQTPVTLVNASGMQTRLESPFILVADSLERMNIRALVLVSDGRYTTGSNPIFESEKLGIPVYTVALGDSAEPKDLSVSNIFTNEITYVGSELPVEVRVQSSGYAGGTAIVSLSDESVRIGEQRIALNPGTNEYTLNFSYRATTEGIEKLRAVITGDGSQELTLKNNSRSVFVKVKSNKRSYVLIAGTPSPDVAFIRRLLESDRNIVVRSYVEKNGAEFLEGTLDAASFRDCEAVVLIGYPTSQSSETVISTVRHAVESGSLPLLFIASFGTDAGKLKSLESLLPVTVGQERGTEMQTFIDLTQTAGTNPILRGTNIDAWNKLPPIFRTETSYRAKPESELIATARIGSAKLDDPMVVSRRLGRSRSLAVLGYGLYRWQLLGDALNVSHGEPATGVLSSFITNSLRWLATREDQKQVRVTTDKQLYGQGEPVRLQAQVYDESFDPISDAVVLVNVGGPAGEQNITLSPLGSGRYEGVLTGLVSGDYRFTGSARYGGREIGRDQGRFAIGEISAEFARTSMDAGLMRGLAARTGGKFYTARTSGSLIRDLTTDKRFAPRSVESRKELALWNLIWVLGAALFCFACEWFLRKRSGML